MSLHQQVQQLILSYFPHTPTDGQLEACSRLVDFLYDANPYAAFVLKGYAGTGKTSLVSWPSAATGTRRTLLLLPQVIIPMSSVIARAFPRIRLASTIRDSEISAGPLCSGAQLIPLMLKHTVVLCSPTWRVCVSN